MTRSALWAVVAASACGKLASTPPDAVDACSTTTYYLDADGDGHGDPTRPSVACEPPIDTVTSSDDCDDGDVRRAPGLVELCDDLDNDCDAATLDTCPAGCVPRRGTDDLHVYLACDLPQTWAAARITCEAAGETLVEIDSDAENAFVRTFATEVLGAGDVHLGASDLVTEGTFAWEGGAAFWSGGPNGAPVDGRYANWSAGEPNNDGGEDCARLLGNGRWDDNECGRVLRFVCRRTQAAAR